MKIEVTFNPTFHLPLTLADAQLLRELAGQHYDGACKAAADAGPGGFINGWCNWLTPYGDPEETPTTVEASTHEIDLALKILAMRGSGLLHGRDADLQRANMLARDLRSCLDRWPFIKPASTTINTEPAARGHHHG